MKAPNICLAFVNNYKNAERTLRPPNTDSSPSVPPPTTPPLPPPSALARKKEEEEEEEEEDIIYSALPLFSLQLMAVA